MRRTLTVVAVVILVVVGLDASGKVAGAETTAALNCQHAQGDGVVRSADYLHVIGRDDTHVGAVQLCKDTQSRYWGYVVLYSPMPAGKWGNATIDVFWDGQMRASYSCEGATPTSSGNKHIKQGETMCWTPKLYGTDPRWTYFVYGDTFTGSFPDTGNLYSHGQTVLMYR